MRSQDDPSPVNDADRRRRVDPEPLGELRLRLNVDAVDLECVVVASALENLRQEPVDASRVSVGAFEEKQEPRPPSLRGRGSLCAHHPSFATPMSIPYPPKETLEQARSRGKPARRRALGELRLGRSEDGTGWSLRNARGEGTDVGRARVFR